ncbi:hypothetical protein [Dyadobacter sp. OTU695]|uniref:hypothetical protein n=1 Tax=Dyadobacter sp. OTU695 TaxID=3043860 RepID=UPI00313BD36C
MRGHYFLKWLFLTVLSVSTLHFRERSNVGHHRIEQISFEHNVSQKLCLDFSSFKAFAVQSPTFVYFKNAQHAQFIFLSNSLSTAIGSYPELSSHLGLSSFHIQNQHFRSRTLPSDDFSIFQS